MLLQELISQKIILNDFGPKSLSLPNLKMLVNMIKLILFKNMFDSLKVTFHQFNLPIDNLIYLSDTLNTLESNICLSYSY